METQARGRRYPCLKSISAPVLSHFKSLCDGSFLRSLHAALGVENWGWVETLLTQGTTSVARVMYDYNRECDYYVGAEREASESGNHKRAGLYQWIRRTVQVRHLLGVLANHSLFPGTASPSTWSPSRCSATP